MRWHKLNVILHRDVGYLAFALTIVYGVSGLAVNHRADWNPSIRQTKTTMAIAPVLTTDRDAIVSETLSKLSLTEKPRNTFRPDPETLRVFYENLTYSVDLPTGKVVIERAIPRPVLKEFNDLHLNAPKGVWTYIADVYAVSLILLAVTGLFVLKGKNGITRRGAWLTAIGVVIPGAFWIYHLYWA
ncbi:MAG: PepSY-associated TM helix domain-containing protein [Acidobacteria bacterium]|nr:PepSY-associated TM helix domain-containing protein [Acidobacteriota bacterium]